MILNIHTGPMYKNLCGLEVGPNEIPAFMLPVQVRKKLSNIYGQFMYSCLHQMLYTSPPTIVSHIKDDIQMIYIMDIHILTSVTGSACTTCGGSPYLQGHKCFNSIKLYFYTQQICYREYQQERVPGHLWMVTQKPLRVIGDYRRLGKSNGDVRLQ